MDVLLQSDTCPNETLLLIEGAAVFRFARKTSFFKIKIENIEFSRLSHFIKQNTAVQLQFQVHNI